MGGTNSKQPLSSEQKNQVVRTIAEAQGNVPAETPADDVPKQTIAVVNDTPISGPVGTRAEANPMSTGRYRIASKESTEAWYESQPGAKNPNAKTPDHVHDMTPQELKKYITETEGLNMGQHKMRELGQTWRFLLASDPVQHGFDAGLLAGTLLAGCTAAFRPAKRKPVVLMNYFVVGFMGGLLTFPLSLIAWEQYNMARINAREQDMFAQQRADFYNRLADAQATSDPTKERTVS